VKRMVALWTLPLIVVIGLNLAHAEEDVLPGKGLRADGAMFVSRLEEDVKEASEAVEARLKDYRRAASWEKISTRDEASRKAMATQLTKQRDAMKKELNRVIPQINAQTRMLSQHQTALRQRMQGLQYGTSTVTAMAYNQLVDQHNALTEQIDALQSQNNRLVDSYNALGEQIEWLDPREESAAAKTDARTPTASAEEKREDYIEALTALRKIVDETKQTYEELKEDAEVQAALKSRNSQSSKVKYVLGPTKKFLKTVEALELSEEKVNSDSILESTKSTTKRKSRTGKRR